MMKAVILCDIPLKNLAWKVFRVLMMRAVNSGFSFPFAMDWVGDGKTIVV